MPLDITSLGGGHTDTHIHTLHGQDQSIGTSRASACSQHESGLKRLCPSAKINYRKWQKFHR